MGSLPIYDRSGSKVGDYEISPEDLAEKISMQLLHDAVVMYQANLRQGTKRTRSRGEVAGSTKKMYRQKGTGNARAGSRRSGLRRGGGHIHALRPRKFGYRMPKKALRSATRMALAAKVRDEEVVLINELNFAAPKTREMAAILSKLPLAGARTLVATDSHDVNVYKSARNIAGVTISPVSDLNALTILQPGRVLMTTAALDRMKASRAG